MRLNAFSIAAVELLIGLAGAVSVQENYTICNWARLRAGVVRDGLYLDGGLLWWQTAFADGTAPVVSSDGNVAGDMFRLNFSTPFDTTTTNLSALFERMAKAGGAGNNIAPNYIDGTMFTNDGELYLYGGLAPLTDSASPQSADTILGYEAYQYGTPRESWTPGFYQGSLPEGVSRYITNGAGVSAPSENLGFYLSGMRSPSWGPIYYEDSSANETANTLIEVDMSTMRQEKWTNTTLPDNIPLRANAELAWIPVSDKGVLIAIGGVTEPEEIWSSGLNSSQLTESKGQSPGLMTSLPVYDIASSQWYMQNTTGDAPGQLTEFCSVVASAQDGSSFNVYIYGGYDGLNAYDPPSDDVWILSVPSFTWVKGYSGNRSHGRSGHRCVMPYPDQMLVVGGIHQNQAECVEGGIIQVFNLNKLEFQTTYDPDTWSDYEVPAIVTKAIGGDGKGGSSKAAIWSDDGLAGVFSQKYPKQLTHYYPYKSDGNSTSTSSGGGSGVTKGAIIGIGVAAAVIVLLVGFLIFLLVRRRRKIRSGASEKSVQSSNSRVTRWLNGASCAPTPKYQSGPSPPEVQQVPYAALADEPTSRPRPVRHEMAGTERPKPPYELATPYNNQDHPRHSGIADNGYNANYGHTYTNAHSQSTSSGEYRPSPLTSSGNGNSAGNVNAAGANPLSSVHLNPHDDISTPSHSSYSTNETVAWPLPRSTNTWRGQNDQRQNLQPANRPRRDRERSSEGSSVQPIIEETEQEHARGHARGGSDDEHEYGYQHSNESRSSGLETLPSPGPGGNGHEANTRSMWDTIISPISPTMGRH